MAGRDSLIQLFAGASGGTMGAIVTCPLEVVKTRLQSSQSGFSAAVGAPLSGPAGGAAAGGGQRLRFSTAAALRDIRCLTQSAAARCPPPPPASGPASLGLVHCMRLIVQSEGVPALFKGLGPNLVGVAPSRAIYFCAYQNAKTFFNQHMTPDTSAVHTVSAVSAGLTSSTVTNPIWMVKTRLQLDRQRYGSRLLLADCVRRIYARHGLLGFYKGVSASYYGVTETVIHFVLYEKMKRKIDARRAARTDKTLIDFVEFMMAGALSKTVASCVAYPHEVARTRLREEGNKYRSFVQTLRLVWHEEGYRGLYRGLGIQLLRQIPNTAIVMATYEACVYFLRDRPSV